MSFLPNAVNDYIFNVDYYYHTNFNNLNYYSCIINKVYYNFKYYRDSSLFKKILYLGQELGLPFSKIVTHTFLGYRHAEKTGAIIGLVFSGLSFAYDVKKYNEIQYDDYLDRSHYHHSKYIINFFGLNIATFAHMSFKKFQVNDISIALAAISFAEFFIGFFELIGTTYDSQNNINYPFINKPHEKLFDFSQLSIKDICDFENYLTLNNQKWEFDDKENFCNLDLTKTLFYLFNIPLKPNLNLCYIFKLFPDEEKFEAIKFFKDKIESCKNDDLIQDTVHSYSNKTISIPMIDYFLENLSSSEGYNPLHYIMHHNDNLNEYFLTKGIDYANVDTLNYIINNRLWHWIEPVVSRKTNMTKDGYIAKLINNNYYSRDFSRLDNKKLFKFCELFIKFGADINQAYKVEFEIAKRAITPFIASIKDTNYELTKFLLDKGIAINHFTEYFKNNLQTLLNDSSEGKIFPYDYPINYELCEKEFESSKLMKENPQDRDQVLYESSKITLNYFCPQYFTE